MYSTSPGGHGPYSLLHQGRALRLGGLIEWQQNRWEFDKGDQSLAISVSGSLNVDDLDLVIQAALDGAGLAWVAEDRIAQHLATGDLVCGTEDWCRFSRDSFSTIPVGSSSQRHWPP